MMKLPCVLESDLIHITNRTLVLFCGDIQLSTAEQNMYDCNRFYYIERLRSFDVIMPPSSSAQMLLALIGCKIAFKLSF